MLRRRFKPEKCKIALKLAIPRIKVMRNKKEAQFKQFKRELAQLLESGQDQTARIRVEHVVREEKTMVAYDLLEIYCELIVARMPSIESQKNCPIDLKEAISSVIFASARCEEIPELKDVTKHLTTKYGKDFTTSALELHPDSGVGRMLVDKLSVKAPDGPTKLKILTAIAEEHNIKWDPESFGAKESKVYDNLMNGPSTLPEATKMSAGPHNTQASTSYYVQRPPSVQDPKHIAKSDVPSSFYEHKSRLSPHPKNFDYSNTSANNSISSGAYHPRSKPQQTENQGMEFRNSSYRNESASPREHGNMEFKDATAAAAQVAAESAERASMAARATAELSSHGNIAPQYSMESNISGHGMRDEEPRKYIGSASQFEYLARHPVDTSFHERNSTKYEQTDSNKQYNRTGETENGFTNFVKNDGKSTHCSSKSTADSFNEKPSVNNQIPDAYSQINSSVGREMEHFSEMTMKRNSGNEMQFVNELHGIKNPQNVDDHEVRDCEQSSYSSHSRSNTSINDCDVASNLDWQKSENDNRNSGEKMQFVNELHDRKNYDVTDYQEERIGKQSSFSSSSSSSTFNDDVDVVSNFNHQKLGNFSVDNSVLLNDKGSLQRNTIETTYTYDNASAVFDDYGSYNDEGTFVFEEEHKVHEKNMNLSYPFQRSPAHPCPCTNSLGFKQKVESQKEPYSQSHIFSEQRSTPVFFESSTSSAVPSHGNDLPPTFDKYGPSSESEDEVDKSDRTNNPSIGSQKRNMDSHQAENSVFNQRLAGGMEDTELSNDSSPESKELNFGKLIGGLRNKGYRHPPYLKIPQGSALSSGEAENDTSARIKQASPPLAVEDSISTRFYNQEWCSRKGSGEASQKLNKRISVTPVDSSDDDFEEERPKQTFSSTRDLYNILPSSEENKRSTSRVPMPYFDSRNSDSDEDLPKTGSKVHSSIGFSHKTTASPNSGKGSTVKAAVSSESTLVSNPIPYFGPGNSDSDEDLPKTSSKARSSTIFSHRTTASPNARRGSTLKTTVSSESKLVFDPMPHFGPGNSDSDEDLPKTSSKARSSMIFSHRTTASPNARRGSTLKTTVSSESKVVSDPMPYLGPGNTGSDEDLPETSSKTHSSTGFAHKTMDSPSNSQRGSTLKTTVSFEPAVVSDYGGEKNSSSRSCSADEALPELQSHKRNSDNRESFQNSQLAPETKMNSSDGSSKSSENEQPSTSVPVIVSSGSAESSKAQNSTEGRPSYVHPKLPDYDTLAAHLNSLRQNHQ